jgi:hypothetical protein
LTLHDTMRRSFIFWYRINRRPTITSGVSMDDG